MSLRFGSGWLLIYFLICSCTFKCSAPQLRARDYTTFNPFEPLPFSVTPDTRFWVTFSPLQGRAALTVEVTRPRGRPANHCCMGAFQNSQRLEMCGAPRSGQRGWSTCTPSRVHIPDVLSATRKLAKKTGFEKVRAPSEFTGAMTSNGRSLVAPARLIYSLAPRPNSA